MDTTQRVTEAVKTIAQGLVSAWALANSAIDPYAPFIFVFGVLFGGVAWVMNVRAHPSFGRNAQLDNVTFYAVGIVLLVLVPRVFLDVFPAAVVSSWR